MHRVTFQQDKITYDAEEGQWLYDVCEAAGSSVPFACKAGACGTCATQVVQGVESLGPQRGREIRTLEAMVWTLHSIDFCAWRTFTDRSL